MSAAGLAALVVVLAWPLGFALRVARPLRRGGVRDRVQAVAAAVGAVVLTVAARQLLPWDAVPPLLWALPVAATAFGVLALAVSWRRLPALAAGSRVWRLGSAGAGVAVGGALIGLMLLA